MSTITYGELPAFPAEVDSTQPDGFQTGSTRWQCYGVSIRDYFAAKALQGLLASDTQATDSEFAEYSWRMADAMLKARAKNGGA